MIRQEVKTTVTSGEQQVSFVVDLNFLFNHALKNLFDSNEAWLMHDFLLRFEVFLISLQTFLHARILLFSCCLFFNPIFLL